MSCNPYQSNPNQQANPNQEQNPYQQQFNPYQQQFNPYQQQFNPYQQQFNPYQQQFNPYQQQFNPYQQQFNPYQQQFNPYQQQFNPYQQPTPSQQLNPSAQAEVKNACTAVLADSSQAKEPSPSAQIKEPSPSAQIKEPSPSAPAKEPSPTESVKEPSPSAPVKEPSPSAPAKEPSPSAQAKEPSPSAQAKEPSPSAQAKEPSPSAQAKEPSPSAQAKEPSPSAQAKEPSPSAQAKEPSPSAPVKEPSPSAPAKEPSPTESVKEPSPSAPAKEPSPSAPAKEPSPSAQAKEPSPSAQAKEPSPSAQAKEPSPSAQAKEPSPSAQAKEPSPSAQAKEPSPSAQAKEPSPSAQAKEPSPSAPAKEPSPSAQIKEPSPSAPAKKAPRKRRGATGHQRDARLHCNVVFCGHVDAGKSSLAGRLLADAGLVDARELAKCRREAELHHREGWEFAYVMDVAEEERARGKTHETGAAYFETADRRVTILDAPGHRAFVPSMIGGAAQADICVLVISSRTGEFEAGFEGGGQTREHAMLVRACGVKFMIVAINKMDEHHWSQERYMEIRAKLEPFLRQNGYSEKNKNITFMPVAALFGEGLVKTIDKNLCNWYTGPSLMSFINNLKLNESKTENDSLAVPLVGAYKDDGKVYIYGKIESGSITVGDVLTILPMRIDITVENIQVELNSIEKAYTGENVHIQVKGIDETLVHSGCILVDEDTQLCPVEYFQARIIVLEVKNLLSNGSRMMMNMGVAETEVTIHKLLAKLEPKSQEIKVIEKEPSFVKGRESVIARLELSHPMVLEDYRKFDKLGRFMLREEGRTIAIGLVLKLYTSTKESLKNE